MCQTAERQRPPTLHAPMRRPRSMRWPWTTARPSAASTKQRWRRPHPSLEGRRSPSRWVREHHHTADPCRRQPHKWRLALPPLRADRPLGPQLPSHRKRDDRSPSITLPPVRRQDSARATHRQAQGWPVGGQVGPPQVRSGPPRPYGVHHRGRCCPRPGRRWRLRGERAEAYIVALCVCV